MCGAIVPDRGLLYLRPEHGFFVLAIYNGSAYVLPALAAKEGGNSRLGPVVRSHPNTPPIPSRTDVVEATFPVFLSLVAGFSRTVELSAWSLHYDEHGVAVRLDEHSVDCQDASKRARLGFLKRSRHNSDML
jgi:hypothetical protein